MWDKVDSLEMHSKITNTAKQYTRYLESFQENDLLLGCFVLRPIKPFQAI